MALIGVFVTVEYDVKVWYYDRADAARTPLRTISRAETGRLYALNMHLFREGLFFKKTASWIPVTERTGKRFGMSIPDRIDFVLYWLVCPSHKTVRGSSSPPGYPQRQGL